VKFLLTGLNHRTAPVEVRERIAFDEQTLPDALDKLKRQPGVVEGLILSTCNRVEVSVTAEEDADLTGAVEGFLADSRQVERAWVTPYLYRYDGPDAIRHLFRVASSLDSMVVGEHRSAETDADTLRAAGDDSERVRPVLSRHVLGQARVSGRIRSQAGSARAAAGR
jgi:glutamyl-tRNA reductase